jgi:hypothetical protein
VGFFYDAIAYQRIQCLPYDRARNIETSTEIHFARKEVSRQEFPLVDLAAQGVRYLNMSRNADRTVH